MEEKSTFRRIWDFAKEHQTITIAVISGIIAITTFLLKNSIYMNSKLFLSYFGINSNYIVDINDKQLYSIIWSIVVQIVLVTINILILDIVETYLYNRGVINAIHNDIKQSFKVVKLINKKIDNTISQTDSEYPKLKGTADSLLERGTATNKKCKRLKCINTKQLLYQLLIVEIITLIASYPVALFNSKGLKELIYTLIIYSLFPIIITPIVLIISGISRKKQSNKFVSPLDNKFGTGENLRDYFIYRIFTRNVFDTIRGIRWRFVLRNFFITSIVFLIVASSTGYNSAKHTKEFSVFQENGYSYAVIYDNGESFVAEKIDISNKNATIHKNERIKKSSKDISFKVIEFETVELVDN